MAAEWTFYCCTVPHLRGTAQTTGLIRGPRRRGKWKSVNTGFTRAAPKGAFGRSLFLGTAFTGNVCGGKIRVILKALETYFSSQWTSVVLKRTQGLENNDDSVAPHYFHCLYITRTDRICQKFCYALVSVDVSTIC